MRKLTIKRKIVVLLVSFALFIVSIGAILGLSKTQVKATETQTTGIKITATELAGDRNTVPALLVKLYNTVSLEDAKEIVYNIEIGEAQQMYYFGVITDDGYWYEFGGKGGIPETDYKVANSLEGLVTAEVKHCNAWTSSYWLAKGNYYALSIDDFYCRGAFNNYRSVNTKYDGSIIGTQLDSSKNIGAIVIRDANGNDYHENVSFTLSSLWIGDGGYKQVADFSEYVASTNVNGTNTNAWSAVAGTYFQGSVSKVKNTTTVDGVTVDDFGWTGNISILHYNNEVVAKNESFDGIKVKANGVTETVQNNASLIVNLPVETSVENVKNILFNLDINESFTNSALNPGVTPLLIDTKGNYYEIMGMGGIANSTIVFGKTIANSKSYGIGAWYGISPCKSGEHYGLYGDAWYSMKISDFYARVHFDNFGGSKDLSKACPVASIQSTQTIKSVGFRINNDNYSVADIILGDVYLEYNDGTYAKILDASAVSVSENYGYAWGNNVAWLGYIGGYGATSNGVFTSAGYVNACYEEGTRANGMDIIVAKNDESVSTFDGINYKMTVDTATNFYSGIELPKYNGSVKDKVIVIRIQDLSGKGYPFELKFNQSGTGYTWTDYAIEGYTAYYFDKNFNFVSQKTANWQTTLTPNFDGYLVVDLSTVTTSAFVNLADYTHMGLLFGFHQSWNNNELYNVSIGKVCVSDADFTSTTDLVDYIDNAEVYFDFADDTVADGIKTGLNFRSPDAYGVDITRTYGVEEVVNLIRKASLNDLESVAVAETAYNALSNQEKATVYNAGKLQRLLVLSEEVSAFSGSFNMIDGAQVYFGETSGLRFSATMSVDTYNALETALTDNGIEFTMGTLIAPKDYGTLNFDATFNKLDIERTVWGQEVDGTIYMNAAIVDIIVSNYARDFSAISYLTFEYEGETVVLYANGGAISRNVKAIAEDLLGRDTAWTTSQLAILNAYAGINSVE